jgi:CheY-like chemotaxis protein
MDIQMPDIDGYQATGFIRNEIKSNVPIIAMTAYLPQAEKDKCLAAGMNAYLPKPIDESKLRELLAKYIPSTIAGKQPELINQDYLLKTFRKNNEFVKNILELFITQLPKDLIKLKQAATERNCQQVKLLAHYQKSTVISVNDVYPHIPELQILEESDAGNPDWICIDEIIKNLLKSEPLAINEAKEFLKKL